MKLLIISNMAHYKNNGKIVGWGPAIEEINHLGSIFDKIYHIACIYKSSPPPTALPYEKENIHLIPIPPAGGEKWHSKLKIILYSFIYLLKILFYLPKVDIVHVRCPANISLIAIILLKFLPFPKYRWVKYAGDWMPRKPDAITFRFCRWWLNKNQHRGVVTINGSWENQPPHVFSFLNPSLYSNIIAKYLHTSKLKKLTPPINLIYVGQLNKEKGVERAILVIYDLLQKGFSVRLDLVGDGKNRKEFEKLVEYLNIKKNITFHGWQSPKDLAPYYLNAHIFLMLSDHEGWPKVLSEGMAYGVVPIASDVGGISYILKQISTGVSHHPFEVELFIKSIIDYIENPALWKKQSINAINASYNFTYDNYLVSIKEMFQIYWGIYV